MTTDNNTPDPRTAAIVESVRRLVESGAASIDGAFRHAMAESAGRDLAARLNTERFGQPQTPKTEETKR